MSYRMIQMTLIGTNYGTLYTLVAEIDTNYLL